MSSENAFVILHCLSQLLLCNPAWSVLYLSIFVSDIVGLLGTVCFFVVYYLRTLFSCLYVYLCVYNLPLG